jgi:hypothetical protein
VTIRCLLFASLVAAWPAHAATTWNAALRTRVESVAQDGAAHDAWAPTARLRLGAKASGADPRFAALVELEGVAGVGGRYDSGANDGQAYPAVIDPAGIEIDQAALSFRSAQFAIAAGRQRLVFDNQRFIGNSGWRQNEQTFDAIDVAGSAGGFAWRYAWLDRVHRVAGDRARVRSARERDLDGHALRLARATRWGEVVAYVYAIEDRTLPAASFRTRGLRWSSDPQRHFGLTAEVAQQSDHAAAGGFSHGYRLLELSWTQPAATWRAGIERLQGDGRHAFQTPLATLHAFNGWADVFATTPAAGLEDRYLSANGPWPRLHATWNLSFHDFAATRHAIDYGREWDASLARPLPRGWSLLAKVAHYKADAFARDTTKLWLQLEWTR